MKQPKHPFYQISIDGGHGFYRTLPYRLIKRKTLGSTIRFIAERMKKHQTEFKVIRYDQKNIHTDHKKLLLEKARQSL